MKREAVKLRLGMLVVLLLVACSVRGQVIDTSSMTNGNSFGTRRLFAVTTALQVNTNTANIATNAATGTTNAALIAANTSAISATSNAFVSADTVVSNGVVAGYVAADTVVSNGVVAGYAAADTVVSNALAAAIVAATNGISGISAATATNIAQGVVAASNSLYATAAQGSLADTAVQPADSVTSLTDVSNAGSGLIITSAERTTLGTALQPADGTTISNGVVAGYVAADTVVSNALVAAIAGSSAIYPVSPASLYAAWTFDGAFSNDWWGSSSMTNVGAVIASFSETNGNYCSFDAASGQYIKSPVISVTNDWAIHFSFRSVTNAGTWYLVKYLESFAGINAYMDEAGDTLYLSCSGSNKSKASIGGGWHDVVVSYDSGGSLYTGYFDGQSWFTEVASETVSANIFGGTNDAGASGAHCDLDAIYLFERTLSQTEAERIHTLEMGGQYGVQGLRKP